MWLLLKSLTLCEKCLELLRQRLDFLERKYCVLKPKPFCMLLGFSRTKRTSEKPHLSVMSSWILSSIIDKNLLITNSCVWTMKYPVYVVLIAPTRDCTHFLKIRFVVAGGGFYSYYNHQCIKLDKEKTYSIVKKVKFYSIQKDLTRFLKMGWIPCWVEFHGYRI